MLKQSVTCLVASMLISPLSQAWDWDLTVFNLYKEPLQFIFQPEKGHTNLNDNEITTGTIEPGGTEEFVLRPKKKNIWKFVNEQTQGVLHLSTASTGTCSYRYQQTYNTRPSQGQIVIKPNNLSSLELLPASQSNPNCANFFSSSTKASNDYYGSAMPLTVKNSKGEEKDLMRMRMTRGKYQCSGYSNCIIARPPLRKSSNKQLEANQLQAPTTQQWQKQAIALQDDIAVNEALINKQIMASHNSAISRNYTDLNRYTNPNYFDPNHYLSLSEQLDAGVRDIELDILDHGDIGRFRICHNRISEYVEDFTCAGNSSLAAAAIEINDWLKNNPKTVLFVYLDIQQAIKADKIAALDKELKSAFSQNGQSILLSKDDFGDNLDLHNLTTADILGKGKQVVAYIKVNDRNKVFDSSNNVFTSVIGNTSTSVHTDISINNLEKAISDRGYTLDDFPANICPDVMQSAFNKDKDHLSWWMFREDRTFISGSSKDNIQPDMIKAALKCNVNSISLDKISKRDPRLQSFIWSWDTLYPVEHSNENDFAYINASTKRIQNGKVNQFDSVACYNQDATTWSIAKLSNAINLGAMNTEAIINKANAKCQEEGALFAMPIQSTQMHALTSDNSGDNILVNYYYDPAKEAWISNNNQRIMES